MKLLIFIKRCALLCKPTMIEEVTRIKCPNDQNSLDEEFSWRINLIRDNKHLKMKAINRRNFEEQDMNQSYVQNSFILSCVKFSINSYIDQKALKTLCSSWENTLKSRVRYSSVRLLYSSFFFLQKIQFWSFIYQIWVNIIFVKQQWLSILNWGFFIGKVCFHLFKT